MVDLRRAPELWLSAVIVVADQVTKALVRAKLPLYDSVNVIPGMLDITHATNSGAAFGILSGVEFPYKSAVMVLVALVALAAVGLYAMTLPAEQRVARVGLALILGGACGNLIDRAAAGRVLELQAKVAPELAQLMGLIAPEIAMPAEPEKRLLLIAPPSMAALSRFVALDIEDSWWSSLWKGRTSVSASTSPHRARGSTASGSAPLNCGVASRSSIRAICSAMIASSTDSRAA